MTTESLVKAWFAQWQKGEFYNLPVSSDFKHSSPFGTIQGKAAYIKLVEANKGKFLGYRFIMHDELHSTDKACVRYTAIQGDFELEVSEWFYISDGQISEIIAYYHIGEIRDDRKLKEPG